MYSSIFSGSAFGIFGPVRIQDSFRDCAGVFFRQENRKTQPRMREVKRPDHLGRQFSETLKGGASDPIGLRRRFVTKIYLHSSRDWVFIGTFPPDVLSRKLPFWVLRCASSLGWIRIPALFG